MSDHRTMKTGTGKRVPQVRGQICRAEQLFERLEDRKLLAGNLPGLHLVDPVANYFAGQVIYLDFNGEQDVTYDGPVVIESIDVPAFKAPKALSGQETTIIASVVDGLSRTFADSGLVFTTDRPAAGSVYSTVYIGGDDAAFSEYGSFLGLAEQIDVGNRSPTDNAFVFSSRLDLTNADQLTRVAAHEIGHLIGYTHNTVVPSLSLLSEVAFCLADYCQDYQGTSGTFVENITPPRPDSYSFEVDRTPYHYYTEWYKNGDYQETDRDGYTSDPWYEPSLPFGSTIIEAVTFDANYNFTGEIHRWNATVKQSDLIIEDIWTTPSDPSTDDTVELWARVKNQGNGDANSFWVSAYLDGSYVRDENLYWGLDAGVYHDEKIATVSSLSAGSHTLLIKADLSPENGHNNLISESNEGNNTRSESFNVHANRPGRPGTPDLASSDDYGRSNSDNITYDITQIRPPNGDQQFSFSWSSGNGANRYYYRWDGEPSTGDSHTSGTSVNVSSPGSSGQHRFYVRSYNTSTGLLSTDSSSLALQIDREINRPTVDHVDLYASDDSGYQNSDNYTNDTNVRFDWTGNANGGSGVDSYFYGWGNNPSDNWTGNTSNKYVTGIHPPMNNGTYRFTVAAKAISGLWGYPPNYSDYLDVTWDTTSPESPGLLSPINDIVVDTKRPLLDWSGVAGVQYWDLKVESDTFGFDKLNKQNLPSLPSEYTPTNNESLPEERLKWRVRGKDKAGNIGSWSAYEYFTVDLNTQLVEITAFVPPRGNKNRGDSVNAEVTIKNNSPTKKTYWIGLSFAHESTSLSSWPKGWYDIYPEKVDVNANASITVSFKDIIIPKHLRFGQYYAVTRVWSGYDQEQSLMEGLLADSLSNPEWADGPSDTGDTSFVLSDGSDLGKIIAQLRDWVETTVWSGQSLEDAYHQGKKPLLYLQTEVAGTYGIGNVHIGGTFLIDLADLARITPEGKQGWVTTWVDVSGSLGVSSPSTRDWNLGADIGIIEHSFDFNNRAVADDRFELRGGVNGYIPGFVITAAEWSSSEGWSGPRIAWSGNYNLGLEVTGSASSLLSYEINIDTILDPFADADISGGIVNWVTDIGRKLINTDWGSSMRVSTLDDGAWKVQDGEWQQALMLDRPYGEKGVGHYFKIDVPNNTQEIVFESLGGQGDMDLYVRPNGRPTLDEPNSRHSITEGSNIETVRITNPSAGWWYVLAAADNTYSNVRLRVTLNSTQSAEIDVVGNNLSIVDGDNTPSTTDGTDFGSALVSGGVVTQQFTIYNTGDAALHLTGNPYINIQGENPGDFTVVKQPNGTVAVNGSTTFTIEFDPKAVDDRTANIAIANDDSNENPYNFAILGVGRAPAEIDIQGRGLSIKDGDNTPSITDGTDFGSVPINGWIEHTFRIGNTGQGLLSLTGNPRIKIQDKNADSYSVVAFPPHSVNVGEWVEFTIRYNPTSHGLHTARILIENNDSDEGEYTFLIQGAANEQLLSEIEVQGNGLAIQDGDDSPRSEDGTVFGSALVSGGKTQRTFWIVNSGTADLVLAQNPRFEGSNASDFTLTKPPSLTIRPKESVSFVVTFDPGDIGERNANVVIENNDIDESSYTFAVCGTGTINTDDVPTASLQSAEDITDWQTNGYNFTVEYKDDIKLDLTSFGSGDLLVTGPGGFERLVSLVKSNPSDGNKRATVEYSVMPQGGLWAEGEYTISIVDGAVWDNGSNPVVAGDLGTFNVEFYSLQAVGGTTVKGTSQNEDHWIVILNNDGDLVVFDTITAAPDWGVYRLGELTNAPKPAGEAVIWTSPNNTNLVYVAGPSVDGFILYTMDSVGKWQYRNLTTELGIGTQSPVGQLTQFTTDPKSGSMVFVAGMNAAGELVAFQQTGQSNWDFVNISDDLASQEMQTPMFTDSKLTSYVTPWDVWTIAGIDANGDIQGVWLNSYIPEFKAMGWRVDNLSDITGATPIAGQLTVTQTSWKAINLGGVDPNGHLVVTWWMPGMDGEWVTSDITTNVGGPILDAGKVTGWVASWGAINYASLDSSGDVVVYWWTPTSAEELPDTDGWRVDNLTENMPSQVLRPTSKLTSYVSDGKTMSILGASENGDVMRLWWRKNSDGSATKWKLDDLSLLAIYS